MSPLFLLERLYPMLSSIPGHFAVAGGLAASIYREKPRLTNDLDIAIDCGDFEATKAFASEVLNDLGLKVSSGWIVPSPSNEPSQVDLLIGHMPNEEYGTTIDFLLPSLPWVAGAVERAQHNEIDYGNLKLIPTILPEDLIVSKLFALTREPKRLQDLDDIQSLINNPDVDLNFPLISVVLKRLDIELSPTIHTAIPSVLAALVGIKNA